MTTLLLADDHEMVRECIGRALEAEGEFEVIAQTGDGREAVELAAKLKPDLSVLSVWLPHLSGIEATREIVRNEPGARVLILTIREGRAFIRDAFKAGAQGYIVKNSPFRELLAGLREVRQGNSFLSPSVTRHVVGALNDPQKSAPDGLASLTSREREILQRIAEGQGAKEIAQDLNLSPRTVETHRQNMMRKLDVHKLSALVRLAIREGLLEP